MNFKLMEEFKKIDQQLKNVGNHYQNMLLFELQDFATKVTITKEAMIIDLSVHSLSINEGNQGKEQKLKDV